MPGPAARFLALSNHSRLVPSSEETPTGSTARKTRAQVPAQICSHGQSSPGTRAPTDVVLFSMIIPDRTELVECLQQVCVTLLPICTGCLYWLPPHVAYGSPRTSLRRQSVGARSHATMFVCFDGKSPDRRPQSKPYSTRTEKCLQSVPDMMKRSRSSVRSASSSSSPLSLRVLLPNCTHYYEVFVMFHTCHVADRCRRPLQLW